MVTRPCSRATPWVDAAPPVAGQRPALPDAQARNRADGVRIEAGQFGEMAATRHVIAVGAEARCARRQQHHAALLAQRRTCQRHRLGQIARGVQAEAAGIGQRLQHRVDARAVAAHGHDLHRRYVVRHVLHEIGPVQATVVPAHQQRDALAGETFQRCQAGVRRGADRIVDVGQAIGETDALQAVRQRAEILHRRCQRHGVETQRFQRGQHRAQVAAVVPARQWRVAGIEHGLLAPVHDIAAHVPALRLVEPDHLAVGQRQRGQVRIGRIEHGDARRGFGDQPQLVFDVTLLAAVPVQVFREKVQHHRHLRMGATARHFAGLVAGQLHRPILGRGLRVQHFQQRQADVADQAGAMPRRAQQVRDQRGGGALALGAGHAHGVVHDAVVGRVFGKPQRARSAGKG
ncbi:hypothetical protein G6F57_014917 [Rhizopus arrhizus]|nr:hypothetical protein G6F57_014917 [Rhizopus arrhizus]